MEKPLGKQPMGRPRRCDDNIIMHPREMPHENWRWL